MKAARLSDPLVNAHYSGLASEFPAMSPMRELVERLCRQVYAEQLSASTSHDVLVIGLEDATGAGITIQYLPDAGLFRICYHAEDGGVQKHKCAPGEAERLIDAFAIRVCFTRKP